MIKLSSDRRPWYKWFPGQFHIDDKVQMLPEIAKYVYRDILDLMWQSNDTRIPNDINLLYDCIGERIAKALRPYCVTFAFEQFEALWHRIQYPGFELFKVSNDGKWLYSKKLSEQNEELKHKSNVGKSAASERWKKKQCQRNANAMPTQEKRNTDKDIDKDIKERKKKKDFIPPSIQDIKTYFIENGYSETAAEKAFRYYEAGSPPWHDSKGNPVKSWKQKMQSVWFKDENRCVQKTESNNPNGVMDYNAMKAAGKLGPGWD